MRGMPCRYCGGPSRVLDSRHHGDGQGTHVRRRRKCLKCGKRFTTREVAVVFSKPLLIDDSKGKN